MMMTLEGLTKRITHIYVHNKHVDYTHLAHKFLVEHGRLADIAVHKIKNRVTKLHHTTGGEVAMSSKDHARDKDRS